MTDLVEKVQEEAFVAKYEAAETILCALLAHYMGQPFAENLPWDVFLFQVEKLWALHINKILPVEIKLSL